jgi:DICT domain-containing protein
MRINVANCPTPPFRALPPQYRQGKRETELNLRRRARKTVAKFFAANPERRHLVIALPDTAFVAVVAFADSMADTDDGTRTCRWRLTRLHQRYAAELLEKDINERVAKILVYTIWDGRPSEYVETFTLDKDGSYEVTHVKIGGRAI